MVQHKGKEVMDRRLIIQIMLPVKQNLELL